MNNESYTVKLLNGWEEVAKRGQLTFWTLLALKDGPKHMADIKDFINNATNHTVTADDRSLYRALRRYHQTEIVTFSTTPGNGPDRKVYKLSPLGTELLRQFSERNIIGTLYQPAIIKLIKEK